MVNRIALATILLAAAAPSWANTALQDAKVLAGGRVGSYDGGCTGGSCGVVETPCEGEACRIRAASAGATQTGNLVVNAGGEARPIMKANVPAPELGADEKDAKDKPGFFSRLTSGKGLMYGLGGAAAGAGIGWLIGGPIGAIVGGLLGAIGGFFLSKMLAK